MCYSIEVDKQITQDKHMQVTKAITLTNDQYAEFVTENTNHEIIDVIFINENLLTLIFSKSVRKAVKQLSPSQVAKHLIALSEDWFGFTFWDVTSNAKGQIKIYHEKTNVIFYEGSGIGAKRFINKYKHETMWAQAITRYNNS